MNNMNWSVKKFHGTSVSEFAMLYGKVFEVVVKEEGCCFKYSCPSNNPTQHDDIKDRIIYKINQTMEGKLINVWCW